MPGHVTQASGRSGYGVEGGLKRQRHRGMIASVMQKSSKTRVIFAL